jgi:F420-non-reducing hydrogenase iron-sulfur subunit
MAEPAYVFKAFEAGADGVLIASCHPGDSLHSRHQGPAALPLLRATGQFGIEPERVRLEWIAASEPAKLVRWSTR